MRLPVILASFLLVVKGQKIAGGEVVSISEYPFASALLTNSGNGEYKQACGGSIITETAILSAASCFVSDGSVQPASWWRARVGSSNANSGGTIYIVNRIIIHPDFDSSLTNDVAILRTRFYMSLVPGLVETVNIAAGTYLFETNQQIWAIGWGDSKKEDSSELRAVQFWIINQQTCTNRYANINITVTPKMLCVGWLDVGVRGQCPGDAGSPLVINGVVVGLYSWTEGCAQGWFPNLNTKISSHAQWISTAARENY